MDYSTIVVIMGTRRLHQSIIKKPLELNWNKLLRPECVLGRLSCRDELSFSGGL